MNVDVRSYPESGQTRMRLECPLCARNESHALKLRCPPFPIGGHHVFGPGEERRTRRSLRQPPANNCHPDGLERYPASAILFVDAGRLELASRG